MLSNNTFFLDYEKVDLKLKLWINFLEEEEKEQSVIAPQILNEVSDMDETIKLSESEKLGEITDSNISESENWCPDDSNIGSLARKVNFGQDLEEEDMNSSLE